MAATSTNGGLEVAGALLMELTVELTSDCYC